MLTDCPSYRGPTIYWIYFFNHGCFIIALCNLMKTKTVNKHNIPKSKTSIRPANKHEAEVVTLSPLPALPLIFAELGPILDILQHRKIEFVLFSSVNCEPWKKQHSSRPCMRRSSVAMMVRWAHARKSTTMMGLTRLFAFDNLRSPQFFTRCHAKK